MMISSRMIQLRLRSWYGSCSMPVETQFPNGARRLHLYGLRGILAICGLFTVFVQTFIPALVWKDGQNEGYQNITRIIFSPMIWDERLISSFFFSLSCHSIALRFLSSPTSSAFSGSIIRRVVRMGFVVTLSSGIVYGVFGGIGIGYIEQFKEILPNQHITAPKGPENGVTAMNAIFNFFWVVRNYSTQAANLFWPTQTLWNLSLIFNQSWTVYFLMIILPYTRPGWHTGALSLFALGSFWTCSWGWYSAAALLFADYSTCPSLRLRLDEGLTIYKRLEWRLSYSLASSTMIAIGFAMKFTWAALPQHYDKELQLRPFLQLSEKISIDDFAAADPYPRLDNFLVIFGILLLSETSVLTKRFFSCKPLIFLGKRSLSIFIAQCIVFWTAGIKLYLQLHVNRGVSSPLAKLAVFAVGTVITAVCAEVIYRLVDVPSQWLARRTFTWLMR